MEEFLPIYIQPFLSAGRTESMKAGPPSATPYHCLVAVSSGYHNKDTPCFKMISKNKTNRRSHSFGLCRLGANQKHDILVRSYSCAPGTQVRQTCLPALWWDWRRKKKKRMNHGNWESAIFKGWEENDLV